MHTDPPDNAEIEAIRTWADSLITAHSDILPLSKSGIPPAIIATAGTATSLAAMNLKLRDYAPARINGHVLSHMTIDALLQTMLKLSSAQRATLPGLEPGRSAVIIPGTLILLQLLQYFGSTACTVSDSGLLEGIIIQHESLKKIIEKA